MLITLLMVVTLVTLFWLLTLFILVMLVTLLCLLMSDSQISHLFVLVLDVEGGWWMWREGGGCEGRVVDVERG